MKLGIIFYSNDPEAVWNAFRFGNYVQALGDSVKIFMLGKGVEFESLTAAQFDVKAQFKLFLETGGKIFACGTCLNIHKIPVSGIYAVSTLKDLYEIVKESDKVVTF